MRFDPAKFLSIHTVAAWLFPTNYSREAARRQGDNTATAMKSVVVDPDLIRLGRRRAAQPAMRSTIIYEMHVERIHSSSQFRRLRRNRGTYSGLSKRFHIFKNSGITAVELLPVFQFDAQDCPPGLVNYWGYAPVSFFAPHQAYSSCQDPLAASRRVS